MKGASKKILTECKRFKKAADKILAKSELIKILNKYGEVSFQGGYAMNLMMSGDIDIYVVGKSFSKEKILKIFNQVVKSTTFNSYWLADYKEFTHKRREFPAAYYIGIKTRVGKEKWKIDIWFLAKKDLKKIKYQSLKEKDINRQKRVIILRLKNLCNRLKKKISGFYICEAVLDNGIKTISQFKKFLKDKYKKDF